MQLTGFGVSCTVYTSAGSFLYRGSGGIPAGGVTWYSVSLGGEVYRVGGEEYAWG
jgi:hypothetical protein